MSRSYAISIISLYQKILKSTALISHLEVGRGFEIIVKPHPDDILSV